MVWYFYHLPLTLIRNFRIVFHLLLFVSSHYCNHKREKKNRDGSRTRSSEKFYIPSLTFITLSNFLCSFFLLLFRFVFFIPFQRPFWKLSVDLLIIVCAMHLNAWNFNEHKWIICPSRMKTSHFFISYYLILWWCIHIAISNR